jgi:hypothetical protein
MTIKSTVIIIKIDLFFSFPAQVDLFTRLRQNKNTTHRGGVFILSDQTERFERAMRSATRHEVPKAELFCSQGV